MRSALQTNVKWAFGWASVFAAVFSVWVVVASLFRDSFQWPEYHTTTWGIVLGYWTAAVLAGVLVGVLRPLTRNRLGSFLVGWVAGALVYGSVAVATGLSKDGPLWLMAVLGLVGGGLALVEFDRGRS